MVQHASYLRDLGEAGNELGIRYQVVPDIHVDDHVFSTLCEVHGQNSGKALDTYLSDGQASAERIRDVIADLQGATKKDGKISDPMTLLNFASGYGRVARHVRNVIPNGKLVTLDIHENAMYFNSAHFGIQAVFSELPPHLVKVFFRFDVVFCLSFLSHQRRERIGPWLDTMLRFVKTGGLLLFAAQGATIHRGRFPHLQPDIDGYAFERRSEQMDLSLEDYGNAITYPKFILRELNLIPGAELAMFGAGAWRDQQDLYVVRQIA